MHFLGSALLSMRSLPSSLLATVRLARFIVSNIHTTFDSSLTAFLLSLALFWFCSWGLYRLKDGSCVRRVRYERGYLDTYRYLFYQESSGLLFASGGSCVWVFNLEGQIVRTIGKSSSVSRSFNE